jgi:hypothetical protein
MMPRLKLELNVEGLDNLWNEKLCWVMIVQGKMSSKLRSKVEINFESSFYGQAAIFYSDHISFGKRRRRRTRRITRR